MLELHKKPSVGAAGGGVMGQGGAALSIWARSWSRSPPLLCSPERRASSWRGLGCWALSCGSGCMIWDGDSSVLLRCSFSCDI